MDCSEFIYNLIKNNVDIYTIYKKFFPNEEATDISFIIWNIKKFIPNTGWLWNNPYKFLEFIYLLPINKEVFYLYENYLHYYYNHKSPIKYKEEYSDIIHKLFCRYIDFFKETQEIIPAIVVLHNYLTIGELVGVFINKRFKDAEVQVLSAILEKQDLYDNFYFAKKLIKG